jgi:heavy metal translocating P-type ATPase
MPPAAACSYCGLPLPARPYRRAGPDDDPFCCFGCALVARLAGGAGASREGSLFLRLGASVFLTVNVMMFTMVLYSESVYGADGAALHGLIRWLLLALTTPVVVMLGVPLVTGAASLRALGSTMDGLIALGVLSGYALSVYATVTGRGQVYFETIAVVLVLVALGRYLEARVRTQASAGLGALMQLVPGECVRITGGSDEVVDAAALLAGDLVRIKPGQIFPVDGRIVEGEAGVDESTLTGESLPSSRGPGDLVFAGTTDLDGHLTVRAVEVGAGRALAAVERLLDEARRSRTSIERSCDRLSAILIPAVAAIALGSFVWWLARAGTERALMTALSVVVIACPCALGLATPLAVWIALGRAARHGILVRRADVLERLAAIRAAAFDKTGTVTSRLLRVTAVVPAPGQTERDVLAAASALESLSEHPLAPSIVACARALGVVPGRAEEFRAHPGLGVSGSTRFGRTAVGNRRLMERLGAGASPAVEREWSALEQRGATAVACAWTGAGGFLEVRGLVALAEDLREGARETLASLGAEGLPARILTGDSRYAAAALEQQLRVPVRAELMPADKVAELARLRAAAGPVLFVGDGINDAPGVGAADVGVALSSACDLTRHAADVALLGADLRAVPWLLALSRRTLRVIRANLAWAFVYNVVGVGLAAAGLLNPVLASLAMVGSSAGVVRNSMRLAR